MIRRVPLAALLLLAFATSAAAQSWAAQMFPERKHDFGDVARGATAEFRYEFKNLYEEDVHISSVRSSCGCTSVRIEKDTLKTHETSAIVAKINTDRFLGRKGATITVTIDKPYRAQVQLQTRVYIRSDVVFEPGSVEVGTIAKGAPVERTVTVAHAGRSDWQITDVVSANPHLTAQFKEISRTGGRVRYQLTVRLDEAAPAGYLREHLVLKTNDYNRTQVPILVQGRIQPPITISPSSLSMGTVAAGQKVTKNIVVSGATPFRVLAIACDDPRFEFRTPDPAAAPKTIHLIPVTFHGGETSGQADQIIRVETDQGSSVPELPAYAVVQ